MTCLTLPISKFFSKFSGEAAALFLYLVIPKRRIGWSSGSGGETRAAFCFFWNGVTDFPISDQTASLTLI
jgi:hypothetical protein